MGYVGSYRASVLGPPYGVHPRVQQGEVALAARPGPVAQALEGDVCNRHEKQGVRIASSVNNRLLQLLHASFFPGMGENDIFLRRGKFPREGLAGRGGSSSRPSGRLRQHSSFQNALSGNNRNRRSNRRAAPRDCEGCVRRPVGGAIRGRPRGLAAHPATRRRLGGDSAAPTGNPSETK